MSRDSDGNASDLTSVAPILKKHGFGDTLYITSGWVGGGGRLTGEQVKKLDAGGYEIGSHWALHPNMLNLPRDEVREQIATFDRACAKHEIRKATTFAYSGGHYDRRMVKALGAAGYVAARQNTPCAMRADRDRPRIRTRTIRFSFPPPSCAASGRMA